MSKTKWSESKESLPTPIRTKAQFVKEYQAGRFGNRAPTWNTLEEYCQSGYKGLVHIRNRVAGGDTWYDVPAGDVEGLARDLVARGRITAANCYFSGMAPTPLTTIQGELRQSENYLDLFYSQVPKPMRASLFEGGKQAYGIAALSILKAFVDPTSLDWIHTLLELYPGHVIEFSTYGVPWGTLNLPTVIWECRSY